MAEPKRKFTPKFKLEAVRLAASGDKPLAQVARELGILPNLLRNWRRQVEGREGQPPADVFPSHGQLPSLDEELRRLRREVESLRQERDFLKKRRSTSLRNRDEVRRHQSPLSLFSRGADVPRAGGQPFRLLCGATAKSQCPGQAW